MSLAKGTGLSAGFYQKLIDDLNLVIANSIVTNTASSVTNLVTELTAYRDIE